MSFESDPTRGYDEIDSDDIGRFGGIASRLASAVDTLEAIPDRLRTHLSEWPRWYVEQQVEAVTGEKQA